MAILWCAMRTIRSSMYSGFIDSPAFGTTKEILIQSLSDLISVSLNIGGKTTRTPPLPDPQHTSPLFPATQVAEEEAGDDAGDEDGNQRAFTDALDAPDFHIGETDGERHEDTIICDLDLAKVQMIGV